MTWLIFELNLGAEVNSDTVCWSNEEVSCGSRFGLYSVISCRSKFLDLGWSVGIKYVWWLIAFCLESDPAKLVKDLGDKDNVTYVCDEETRCWHYG